LNNYPAQLAGELWLSVLVRFCAKIARGS